MKVSKRLRYEVFRRDGHACRYCGAKAPDVELTIDHVVPQVLGGKDEPSNLVTSCLDCNIGKTSSSPDATLVADVAEDAQRWARAMAQATQERVANLQMVESVCDWFADEWESRWKQLPRENWRKSLQTFLAAGLIPDDFGRLIMVVEDKERLSDRDRWKYFCGCCWREITKRQERALEIVEQEPPDNDGFGDHTLGDSLGFDAAAHATDPDPIASFINQMDAYYKGEPPDVDEQMQAEYERFIAREIERARRLAVDRAREEDSYWDASY